MSESLKNKTIKGVAWKTSALITNSGFSFIVSIILARILIPSDYGIIAMITVFTSVLQIFTDGGLSSALIRKENRTESDLATVFFYNLFSCYFIYGLIFIGAPYLAEFYNQPELCKITRIYTISLLITPFYGIQLVLLKSKIDFKTQCKVEVASNIIYAVAAITMVYTGWGIWSLIIPSLISQLILAIIYNIIVRWFPTSPFSVKSFKELFGYSSKLLVARLVNKIYSNIAPLVIGKFFSPALLGLYERAKSWPALPSQTLACSLQSVTFPVLSKIQDDRELLCLTYRKMLKMVVFCIFPLMIGLAAVAKPLTLIMLTEKWIGSVVLMQLICLSYMWFPILLINSNLLTVTGRSDLYLHCEFSKIAIGVLTIVCAMPFGLKAYCSVEIVSSVVLLIISTHFAKKIVDIRIGQQILDLLPITLNCLAMGGISIISQQFFYEEWLKLTVGIMTGVIYYIISSRLFFKDQFNEVVGLIKSRI